MKNKIILFAFAFFLLLNLSSAIITYQQKGIYLNDSHTTRIHSLVFRTEGSYMGISDRISSDELLEVYVKYSLYPQTWNTQNPDYSINNCTFTINYFEHLSNISQEIYTRTINYSDTDVYDDKYFIKLKIGDGFTSDIDCYFQNTTSRILETPSEMIIVSPSWECKACQYYEWTILQRDIEKTQLVGRNSVTIWDFIKELITLNFEIILALFWLLLFIIFLGGIGLLFLGLYWAFLWVRNLATRF